jgi:hypothetical protein
MTAKKRVPQRVKNAFVALEAFAKRNFPAKGRLKNLVVLNINEGSKVLVGGGKCKKESFQPGLYHWWDDSVVGYNPPASGDVHIATPQALNELLTGESREAFLREARKLVDF